MRVMTETSTVKRTLRALPHHAAAFADYCSAREAALTQFAMSHRIQPLWRLLARATDQLLAQVAKRKDVTLVAVGGYGRGEMFPFSDVDVLVLVGDGEQAPRDTGVGEVLQQLWDMHVPVSHATRSIEETVRAAKEDSTITAALMDARYISGNRSAYLSLKRRVQREVIGQSPREFVAAKLSERDHRHSKWGDSRFMLEPNIKEGKGGLRDLQTLTWLARYCYRISNAAKLVRADLLSEQEWRHFREAYLFFATVRAHMHLLRGRADERLTFDLQTAIAQALAFPGSSAQEKAEKFMLRYFQYAREVGALTRIFCAVLEDENLRTPLVPLLHSASNLPDAFILDAGRLQFHPTVDLKQTPTLGVALFHIAQVHGVDIHPRAMLFLGETVGRDRWLALIVGFIGTWIILRPDAHSFDSRALIVLLTSMFWATTGILIKSLSATEPPLRMVFYMNVFMALLAAPFGLYHWAMPSLHVCGILLIIALCSLIMHVSMVRAYALAPLVTLMPFDFTRLISTALFAYLLFGETSDMATWFGAAIIIASAAFMARRDIRASAVE
jgi:predicted nucleotidyltransferase/uncharacterized membrane protein